MSGLRAFARYIRLKTRFTLSGQNVVFSRRAEIYPKAEIIAKPNGSSVVFQGNTKILPFTKIEAAGGKITIGAKTFINRLCTVVSCESITIGEGTTIGPNTVIYDHDHSIGNTNHSLFVTSPVVIGKNCWIGAGVIILKGVHIGDGSVIAAGTIVVKNIPENTVAYGKTELVFREVKLNGK